MRSGQWLFIDRVHNGQAGAAKRQIGSSGEKYESKGSKDEMILWQHTHVRAAIVCNTSTNFGIHHVEGAHGMGALPPL